LSSFVAAAPCAQPRVVLALWLLLALASCNRVSDATALQKSGDGSLDARPSTCPATAKAPAALPNTPPELETLDYWLTTAQQPSAQPALDDVLLDERSLHVHDQALRTGPDGARVSDLLHAPSGDELRTALTERLDGYRSSLEKGLYTSERADAQRALAEAPASFVEQRALYVALAPLALHCVPFAEAIRRKGGDAFDRNRCSEARAQEPIEVLGTVRGHRLARTKNAWGFIDASAPLSAAVSSELEPRYRAGATLELIREVELEGQKLPAGTLLRAAGDGQRVAWLATPSGFVRSRALTAQEVISTRRPLTWRSFLTEAFRYVRTPYGWGDEGGGRDCSRFVLDVLAGFGLELPRTSSQQSQTGRYVIDVPADTSETERLALLDAAHQRGVVLVHFPGHIMFYLGRDQAGTPRVLHSFAEYLAPCVGGGETLFEVGRVGVSDLTLGKGTSRKSFLERMTHLTVFGRAPGYDLLALSRFRAPVKPPQLDPKHCKDSTDLALFRSPREPDQGRPLRVIAVGNEDVRPASLWLVSPAGALIAPEVHDLGVGPYARWVEQPEPMPGKWRALLADGENVLACEEFRVAPRPKKPPLEPARGSDQPAWQTSLRWERDTEALYAAFVEQLFSHPVSDLRSWSSLSELLQKPERNLLFDHRGLGEDTGLTLAPDCADLPYLLRAYFAWKLGLPFAFRTCSRGRAGAPPRCDAELTTNEVPVSAKTELAAFNAYWRKLTNGVHSASGRTLPDDPETDLYPVALERSALMPGTVFTDPYGHMIVVAKWLPQALSGEGMMMGADAQPDATVGRRRFWRGNFLFTPDTRDVGAGFKRFRPVEPDAESKALAELSDRAIADSRDFPQVSAAQYQGSLDDFYARMDTLVYPRPVAVLDRMRRVVDALSEQVERRVEAVDVGEAGLAQHSGVVGMPEGYAIFETSGAWEDFATPSRDMRLLIAIDAVRAFPAQVRARPERFGVSAGAPELGKVDASLGELLQGRRFSYTRSDGSKFELTLADVVARVATLEVAYNPNDCPEYRWGASPGTPEYAPCKRSAPPEQRAAMETYRSWFRDRARPARP
jgi:cell wall-associated NlpC family hydrolase